MVQPHPPVARLRRSIPGRLFAGFMFQFILTLTIVPYAFAVGLITSMGGLPDLLPSFPAAAVWWLIWGMGLTAHAHADADGIHWRYFLSRTYPWSEIDHIRFGGVRIKGSTSFGQAAILVRVGGRDHAMTPGFGCGRRRLVEFGNELIALATAYGVPALVSSQDESWAGLHGCSVI